MCFARGDVRDHVVSHKNDHGPSYRPCRALQRQRRLKIHFREIFRVVRFSTFATVSPRKRTFRQRFNSKSGQSPCPSSRAIDSAVELSKSAIASKRRQLRSPIRWGRSSVLVGYWLGTGWVLVGYWWGTGSLPLPNWWHPQRLRSPRHSVHPDWKVGCFSVSLTVSIQCA